MPVDMFPKRFLEELQQLDPFQRYGKYDPQIAYASVPPKQAFLPGLFLFNHDVGYKLPTWEKFRDFYIAAMKKNERFPLKYAQFFDKDGEPLPGLLHRMSGWYEDSMAHAFLYSILTLVYEDVEKCAFVLYDARVDWKQKADAVILRCTGQETRAVAVSIFGQSEDDRRKVEESRFATELDAKRNTLTSSNIGNVTYDSIRFLEISKRDGNPMRFNGFGFFSETAIAKLLTAIDAAIAYTRRQPMPVPELLKCHLGQRVGDLRNS